VKEISTVSAAAATNTQSATQRKSSAAIIDTTFPPWMPARFHHSHQMAIAVDARAIRVSTPAIRRSRTV